MVLAFGVAPILALFLVRFDRPRKPEDAERGRSWRRSSTRAPGHPIRHERFGRRYIMGVRFNF
jgi:hypothetical protein